MPKKNRGISSMILTILDEGGEYTTAQLAEECRKRGIELEENEVGPVYAAVSRLSRTGKVGKNGKLYSKKMTTDSDNASAKENCGDDTEFTRGIKAIEAEIEKYKNFDLLNASDEQISIARKNVKKLKSILNKIQKSVEVE